MRFSSVKDSFETAKELEINVCICMIKILLAPELLGLDMSSVSIPLSNTSEC